MNFLLILLLSSTLLSCVLAKKTVIIVGAGMAGVSAALTLSEKGKGRINVVVFEGRNRVGGRMHSRFGTLPNGKRVGPAELGAQWIEGVTGNPMTSLAKKYGLPTYPIPETELYFKPNGARRSESEEEKTDEEFSNLLTKAEAWADKQKNDTNFQKAFVAVNRKRFYTSQIQLQCSQYLEYEFASDLSDLSAKFGTDDVDFPGSDNVVPAGFDSIPRKMMNEAIKRGAKLYLKKTVIKIFRKSKSVQVHFKDGSKYKADYVILTVPLGVLKAKSISFVPNLSPTKQGAIRRLGFGKVEKVVFWYKEALWPKNYSYFGFEETEPKYRGRFAQCLNRLEPWGQVALECVALGSYANQFSKLSHEQIKNDMARKLARAFPKLKGIKPIDVWFSSWGTDPFAMGVYSFVKVGAATKNGKLTDFDTLAQPEGRLLFAGEATDNKYWGFTHGGYLTGMREANRILSIYS